LHLREAHRRDTEGPHRGSHIGAIAGPQRGAIEYKTHGRKETATNKTRRKRKIPRFYFERDREISSLRSLL
jgi:hypothetical protein